jgi:hypothetical protein
VMRGAHMELSGWARRILALPPEQQPAHGIVADLQMLAHMLAGLHMVYLGTELRPVATARARARRLLRTGTDFNPGIRYLGELMCSDSSGKKVARLLADGARSKDPDVRGAALVMRANVRENAGQVYSSTRDGLGALRIMERTDIWGTAMICQHLGQLAGQTARYADSVDYYRRSVDLLRQLHAYDEAVEIRSSLAVSLVGMGLLDQARRELAFALGSPDGDLAHGSPIDDPAVRRNHRLAAVVGGIAELELAEGDIDAGLGHYARALYLSGWLDDDSAPGPGALMLASAAMDAHVLYGRVASAEPIARELAGNAVGRLGQFFDLPQIGAVACAVGSYQLAIGQRVDIGLELLALAAKVVARQDQPSANWRLHIRLHRASVGDERMDEAIRRAAGLRRPEAAERVMQLLRELAGSTDE